MIVRAAIVALVVAALTSAARADTPYAHGEVPVRHLADVLSGLYGTTQPGAD